MSQDQFHAEVMAELEQQECAYCGNPVPSSIEPSQFACCGEVGHTTEPKENEQ